MLDIREWSICGGGRLERFYCTSMYNTPGRQHKDARQVSPPGGACRAERSDAWCEGKHCSAPVYMHPAAMARRVCAVVADRCAASLCDTTVS